MNYKSYSSYSARIRNVYSLNCPRTVYWNVNIVQNAWYQSKQARNETPLTTKSKMQTDKSKCKQCKFAFFGLKWLLNEWREFNFTLFLWILFALLFFLFSSVHLFLTCDTIEHIQIIIYVRFDCFIDSKYTNTKCKHTQFHYRSLNFFRFSLPVYKTNESACSICHIFVWF